MWGHPGDRQPLPIVVSSDRGCRGVDGVLAKGDKVTRSRALWGAPEMGVPVGEQAHRYVRVLGFLKGDDLRGKGL